MTRVASVLYIALASTFLWPQESATPSNGNNAAQATGSSSAAIPPDSTKLEPIKIVKAVYPPEARAQNLSGHVLVKVTVSQTGDVDSAEAVSGEPVLAKAAVDAVKEWKFKPYLKNGRPIRVSANIPCDFAPPAKSDANTSAEGHSSPLPLSSQSVHPPLMVDSTATGRIVFRMIVPPIWPASARLYTGENPIALCSVVRLGPPHLQGFCENTVHGNRSLGCLRLARPDDLHHDGPGHTDFMPIEVNVAPLQAKEFTHPQAGTRRQQHEGPLP